MLFVADNFRLDPYVCASLRAPSLPHYVFPGLSLLLILTFAGTLRSQAPATTSPKVKPEGQIYYSDGMQLVRQGHIDDAIRVFQDGLTHDPQDPVMLDATGAAYMLKGDLVQAPEYLLASLRISPGFIPARKNLAIAYFNAGQYDLSAAEFQKLAKPPGPTQQVANLFLGMISEKNGQYADAVSFFARSGALLHQYPEALLSSANAECQLKHAEKAAAVLKALANTPGLTAQQHLKISQLDSQIGEDELALAEVEKAKQVDSGIKGLAYQDALALDHVGRSREALEILKDAATGNSDADTLNLLSHVARENNEFALALDSLREAAKLAPEKEENYLDFSTFCADYGNNQLALDAAEAGLQNIPNSYRLLVQKAVVLESLGRLGEAEDTLRKAGEQAKDNNLALLCLAIVQTHAGKLHEAEATLTAALRQFPNNYYMHYHLGIVLVEIQGGMPPNPELQARAKHAFREAIRLNPAFADSYYQLAKLYSDQSPKLEEQNLVACLRADPNHASAEYKLARIYLSSGRQAEAQVLIDRFEGLRQAAKSKEMQKPRIESNPR
jgi:tetratricopeptide (TPR) repeat protein